MAADTHFPPSLFFGLATAPGHAEDELPDIWLDWALQKKIPAYFNQAQPEARLEFWTRPERELNLAQETGVGVYRLGVDWGRIMPERDSFDEAAIKRYHEILDQIKQRGMKVMLTLMHHSVPRWAQAKGGWLNPELTQDFFLFSQRMIQEFSSTVEWWITFNEANVFATLAYSMGIWPPGEKRSLFSLMEAPGFKGKTLMAMDRMSECHNQIYHWAHEAYPSIKMGIAHHMGFHTGKSVLNKALSTFSGRLMNWRFPERIRGHMDFFGFNYYGAEWIRGGKVEIHPEEEYSEAGRAIYPEGLYFLLKEIHHKYPKLPIIITENGISDSTDLLRPAYLIEHLMAVSQALEDKIPVLGYIFWTLTDNLEWSDGYGPKFGLVKVERETMKRQRRESFFLFQKIVQNRVITQEMREAAWNLVVANQGKLRPMYRAPNGVDALNEPWMRKIVTKDWRFRP